MDAHLTPDLEMPVGTQTVSPATPCSHHDPRKKSRADRYQVNTSRSLPDPSGQVEGDQDVVQNEKRDVENGQHDSGNHFQQPEGILLVSLWQTKRVPQACSGTADVLSVQLYCFVLALWKVFTVKSILIRFIELVVTRKEEPDVIEAAAN